MQTGKFTFSNEQFNHFFPFYILIDSELKIDTVGKSLQKLNVAKQDQFFFDVFEVKRPKLQDFSFCELVKHSNSLIAIESKIDKDIILRGQFEFFEKENKLLFVGSPWFDSMQTVQSKKLKLNDFAIQDSSNDLLHILTTQENVTAELKELLKTVKQQRELLRNSELEQKATAERLTNVLKNLHSGVLIENETRHIVLANQMFCDMFKIPAPPEALTGADCSQSAEQSKSMFKDPEAFVTRIDDILSEQKLVEGDLIELVDGRILRRDYIPVIIEKEYRGHMWTYDDVTLEKNTEKVLQNKEEKYRSIITNMNLGLMEVDLDDNILFANQSFCKMSGYELEEIIGKKASDLFLSPRTKGSIEGINDKRRQGISDAYQLPLKNKKNEDKWWLISGAPLKNDEGKIIGSIGIHLDITHQKEIEKELIEAKLKAEESAKTKEEFLANMSHEIRTPMNVILGMSNQLYKTELNKQQNFYVNTINGAADNLLVIINDILDISKIEAGKLKLEAITFNIRDVIKRSITVLSLKAEEKGLELKMQIDKSIASVLVGDPYRLNQIMLNLISNAVKFTEKGSVEVFCKAKIYNDKYQQLSITVKDTGIGMDEVYQSKLFQKFLQEENSTSRKYGGTGLGLSITKQLVDLMNGEIKVESKKNKGTTIELLIPFPIGKPEDLESENPAKVDSRILNGKRILLVEDNHMNRLLAIEILKYYGAEIDEAINGKIATELISENKYDVVLMDLSMPIMDGYEATSIIRNKLKSATPIIALTANAIKGENKKCLEAGMNDYISKPFDETSLVQTIGKWMGQKISINELPKQITALENELFSLKKIREISKGNENFVQKIVQTFSEQMQISLIEMRNAIAANDYDLLYLHAHKSKTNVDTMCIDSLRNEIRTLEKMASDKVINQETKRIFKKVETVMAQVLTQLSAQ